MDRDGKAMLRAKGPVSAGASRQSGGCNNAGTALLPATQGIQLGKASQLFWNCAPEGLFAIRVSGNATFVFDDANPVYRSLTGIGDAKLVGRSLEDCLPSEMAETLRRRCRHCVVTGKPVDYSELRQLAGTRRSLNTSLMPVKDSVTGNVFMLIGTLQHAAPNRADEHSQQLLERIVDASPDVIYVFDHASGRNTFLSSRVREALGYSREFLQSLDINEFPELIHPEDLPTVKRHMGRVQALADGAVTSVEYRCRTGNGTYRWFRSKETVFSRTRDGCVEKVVGILSDIDRLKKARLAFTDMNARLAAILASISDCYLTINRECRFTDVNSAAAEWLRKDRDDIVGKHCDDIFIGKAFQGVVKQAINQKCSVNAELPSQLYPGRWINLHVYPSGDGVNIFFSDITKRKHAEEEAARSRILLNASIDALSAQIVIVDVDGTIVAANKAWLRFAANRRRNGATVGPGSNYLALHERPSGRSDIISDIVADVNSLLTGRRSNVRHIYQIAGKGRWYRFIAARFVQDGKVFAVVVTEDVTDVKEAKRALGELSERILTVKEDERKRMARELHESTAQHLAAIGLSAMSLRARSSLDAETQELWQDVEESLNRTADELRAFTYLLHTPSLEDDGLSAVLQRYVEGFAARTGLMATLKVHHGIDDLPMLLRQSLLGIVQDALTNVRRHPFVSRVSVEQKFVGDRLHLFVSDDGRSTKKSGNRRSTTLVPAGVDIPGLRERLHRIGGSLEIKTGSRGTTVHVSVPYR